MDPFLLALILVVVSVANIGYGLRRLAPRGDLRIGEPVIVATRRPDDQSIHGVVVRDTPAGITLEAAHYLDPDGSARPIGTCWIERPVAFVQVGVAPLPIVSADSVGEPGRPGGPALPDPRHLTSVAR